MRVRPLTPSRPRTDRRPHVLERPAATPPPPADEHPAERRHRACVAPEDSALYTCGCGFAFQAAVSTSVACPRCGSGQAW
ncbi:MAG TPA: hypothetical protein VFG42_02745 [Baekduia sp.]|uniref:hypothetical protein n=1 Tax=Baekduia sp. TaxID=2600305 RepID=UPI002D783D5F|nr:hypothetical protein [Baekduia sp.]HET6505686.1 hypothetical protein [Baekduia sp.]